MKEVNIPVEEVRKLYLLGLSTRQIAEKTGWSKSYIFRMCSDIARSQRDAAILRQPPKSKSWRACRSQARKSVERLIGRKLESWEDVHHKDHDYTNNSIDNLEILHEADHARHHSTKPKVTFTCSVCGKVREVRKGYLRKLSGKFCSRRCGAIGNSNARRDHDLS